MKKGLTFVYEVDGALYINLTNKCTNNCSFCIRNNGDGAYGSDTLWLEREPTADEVLDKLLKYDISKYSEIVFCGYGEPTMRLDTLLQVAKGIKASYNISIRLNTNGQAALINGEGCESRFKNLIDTVSISLNTPNPEKYVDICHPVYKEKAFYALIDFAKNVKNYVHKTLFSVVRETLSENELLLCRKIAEECGVALRIRDYIG